MLILFWIHAEMVGESVQNVLIGITSNVQPYVQTVFSFKDMFCLESTTLWHNYILIHYPHKLCNFLKVIARKKENRLF